MVLLFVDSVIAVAGTVGRMLAVVARQKHQWGTGPQDPCTGHDRRPENGS